MISLRITIDCVAFGQRKSFAANSELAVTNCFLAERPSSTARCRFMVDSTARSCSKTGQDGRLVVLLHLNQPASFEALGLFSSRSRSRSNSPYSPQAGGQSPDCR